jgi:diaminohydroxyphosphoribosylaminopyrimidine deaminase / 5-amino-6-(5-phosphoribosylamino)uracil reductase
MASAIALGERGRGLATPNPHVGCVIVKQGRVIGRGWTQPGGRPHAEQMALAQAGESARGATAYVSLEPCAHESLRGPCCADALIAAGVGRVVYAAPDPDGRTRGIGAERLQDAGIIVQGNVLLDAAKHSMAGFFSRMEKGRPHITLKLATSLDGLIAMKDGQSRWITGEEARAHVHLERARCDMIIVGRGTYETDKPQLDVRLAGLEQRSPRRGMLTGSTAPLGWEVQPSAWSFADLKREHYLLVEGGAAAASAFLKAGLVDRLLLYRAPILIGKGRPSLIDIGLTNLSEAHGKWRLTSSRMLGHDRLEEFEVM